MMSAKMAMPDLLKKRFFEKKVMMLSLLSVMLQTEFYPAIQIMM